MIDKLATHEADNETLHETLHETPDSGKPEPKVAGARFALFIAILAMFFTLVGIAAGYKHWQRMNDKARSNAAELAELRTRLESLPASSALDGLRKELDDKTSRALATNDQAVQEMARMQNQTRQFADTVAAQVEQITFLQAKMQQSAAPASASEWQIAEVEFLLQLASRELHLAQDTRTATTALKEADALLAKAGSVNYLPVRQQIARDISALEAVPAPDIASISQRINALMLSLKPLPAVESVAAAEQSAAVADNASSGNSLWADYKRKATETFNQAIVIRQNDKPIQTAMDADARLNLYQLLHLRLENLRLLALQRDNAGFRAQLELSCATVSEYYPPEQAKPLLVALDEFGKLDLQPAIPDISASLKQLESARHTEAAGTQVTPAVGKATEKDSKKTGGKRE